MMLDKQIFFPLCIVATILNWTNIKSGTYNWFDVALFFVCLVGLFWFCPKEGEKK